VSWPYSTISTRSSRPRGRLPSALERCCGAAQRCPTNSYPRLPMHNSTF
jgi:hypothetical protein